MLAATRPSTAERVSAPIVSGAVVADETLDSEHVSLLGAVGEVPDTVRLTNATEEFRGKSSGSSFTGKTRYTTGIKSVRKYSSRYIAVYVHSFTMKRLCTTNATCTFNR